MSLARFFSIICNRIQEIAGKLDCHSEGKDTEESRHLVLDVHAVARLGDFKVHDWAVEDRGLVAGADEDDGGAHGEAQKNAANGVHKPLGLGSEV